MSDRFAQALLLALPLVPAIGALCAGLLPDARGRAIRAIGWTSALLSLCVWLGLRFVLGDQGMLVEVRWSWVPSLGISLHFGLDANGFLMAGLLCSVAAAAAVGTRPSAPGLNRTHVVCLLLAEAGMLGAVTAYDLILFIAFWDLTLVAFFVLMGRGPTRGGVAAATRFVVTAVSSSVLMWVGVLWLVRAAGEPLSFDLVELPERIKTLAVVPASLPWLLAAAFLGRSAAMPLHTWFPAASAEVPIAALILLSGGVLPLGGFGLVHVLGRLLGPDLGGAAPWIAWIGFVTALGGGLSSLVQRDLKRLCAFVCLAQVGLALTGLAADEPEARRGGLLMLGAAGLSGTSLSLFAGVLCQARASGRLADISGLWRSVPLFAGLGFAGVASAAAIPGTIGFVGAYHLLWSQSDDPIRCGLLASAVLLIGSSITWAFRRLLGGGFQVELWTAERWPRRRQVGVLALVAAAILLTGLFPGLVSPRSEAAPPSATPAAAQASLEAP